MSADSKIGPARSKRSKNRQTTVRYDPVIDRNSGALAGGDAALLGTTPAQSVLCSIYETKRLCIGNLPSKPTILSSRTRCLS